MSAAAQLAFAAVVAFFLITTTIVGLWAWYLDGRPATGRHVPRAAREAAADAEADAFLAELRAMPVWTVAMRHARPGWELDDTAPQPFAVRLWGATPRELADRIAAEVSR